MKYPRANPLICHSHNDNIRNMLIFGGNDLKRAQFAEDSENFLDANQYVEVINLKHIDEWLD